VNTHIKLADFGLATVIRKEVLGSIPFNSPEMSLGYSPSYSYDIWAFGCILIEMATGHQPFEVSGDHPESERERIQLRLIELFCGQELPKELLDCVDPRQRKRIYERGKLSKYITVTGASALEVKFPLNSYLTF